MSFRPPITSYIPDRCHHIFVRAILWKGSRPASLLPCPVRRSHLDSSKPQSTSNYHGSAIRRLDATLLQARLPVWPGESCAPPVSAPNRVLPPPNRSTGIRIRACHPSSSPLYMASSREYVGRWRDRSAERCAR